MTPTAFKSNLSELHELDQTIKAASAKRANRTEKLRGFILAELEECRKRKRPIRLNDLKVTGIGNAGVKQILYGYVKSGMTAQQWSELYNFIQKNQQRRAGFRSVMDTRETSSFDA